MRQIMHMCVSLQGILNNYGRRKHINFFTDDKGLRVSNKEARQYIAECQAKGWKVIPMGKACDGFDYFGGGCPGHQIHTCEPHDGDFERFDFDHYEWMKTHELTTQPQGETPKTND